MKKSEEFPFFVPVIGVLSVNPFSDDDSNGRIQAYPIRIEEWDEKMQSAILLSMFQMIRSKAKMNLELTDSFEDCHKYLKDSKHGTVAKAKEFFEIMQEKGILFPVTSFDVTYDHRKDEGYFGYVNPDFCE